MTPIPSGSVGHTCGHPKATSRQQHTYDGSYLSTEHSIPVFLDLWLTPVASTDSFTTEMLGSIIDHWAEVLENYRSDSPFTSQRLADATIASDDTVGTDPKAPPLRYMTLSVGFEVKEMLPPGGVQWLLLGTDQEDTQRTSGRRDIRIGREAGAGGNQSPN